MSGSISLRTAFELCSVLNEVRNINGGAGLIVIIKVKEFPPFYKKVCIIIKITNKAVRTEAVMFKQYF